MTVRLVAITEPLIAEAGRSAEEFIAFAARVSNPTNQSNHQTSASLMNYLQRNGHWSPFEMAHAVVEISTTRDIARQILRHRSFAFQEFSQRYAVAPSKMTPREARLQDDKNRQSSLANSDEKLAKWWEAEQEKLAASSQELYTRALAKGLAKEVARAVLPEGLTESMLYMAGSFRSWIHYLALREKPETQKEHRAIAMEIHDVLHAHAPRIF